MFSPKLRNHKAIEVMDSYEFVSFLRMCPDGSAEDGGFSMINKTRKAIICIFF